MVKYASKISFLAFGSKNNMFLLEKTKKFFKDSNQAVAKNYSNEETYTKYAYALQLGSKYQFLYTNCSICNPLEPHVLQNMLFLPKSKLIVKTFISTFKCLSPIYIFKGVSS